MRKAGLEKMADQTARLEKDRTRRKAVETPRLSGPVVFQALVIWSFSCPALSIVFLLYTAGSRKQRHMVMETCISHQQTIMKKALRRSKYTARWL